MIKVEIELNEVDVAELLSWHLWKQTHKGTTEGWPKVEVRVATAVAQAITKPA